MTFTRNQLQERILNCTQTTFEEVALDVFQYQITHNSLYADFVNYLKKKPSQISKLTDVPFMPVGFFKNHKIITGSLPTPIVFESSGTTGSVTSRHYVADTAWYKRVSIDIFEQNYGSLQNTEILALLPSYLERNNSSLVYMVQQFIDKTNSKTSNFFLNDKDGLLEAIGMASGQWVITKSPNHSIAQSLNHSITKSPNHPIAQSLNHPIAQSPNHQINQ